MSDSRLRTTSFADQQNGGNDEAMAAVTDVAVQQTPQGKVTTVIATRGGADAVTEEISYSDTSIIGKGSFGVVFQVFLHTRNERVAIKKVLQDRRFKNRELSIMRSLAHPNITHLHYFFYSSGSKKDEIYLNLVVEFIPENMYQVLRRHTKQRRPLPLLMVKLFAYQMFRALAYLHAKGICHRDIKPQNLLVDAARGILKLCDFGSAKILVEGEPNVAYICSRYYRAPELIFGATHYSVRIDCWSSGCVLAEMLLGVPLFPGESGVDQLVEIIKVLGTPTREQIEAMNPSYRTFKFPQIKAQTWDEILPAHATAEVASLCAVLLAYIPDQRITMLDALSHPFFEEIRQPGTSLDGNPLPELFSFVPEEMDSAPDVYDSLVPGHVRA
eukprot:TRINITY_DN11833_c0_g1_i1.p2 TRINITY_DN11833_c0_g1~~TRINITY_DN11833_c0_g1_i1.p2  ORF type:complete len:386 (+),score=63.72 TRINITY_DN11833_c0_g1_i1:387-1544(+)